MRRTFRKHNQTEQERLYQTYQRQVVQGRTTEEIAKELQVSVSTLYRWQRERSIEPAVRHHPSVDIRATIYDLNTNVSQQCFSMVYSACAFNAWLRWPRRPEIHYYAISAALFQYASKKFGVKRLDELPNEFKDGISKHVSLLLFAEICTPHFAGTADFDLYYIDRQKYTDLDVAANLAWFLAASDRTPTAAHAHEALSEGVQGKTWKASRTTFNNFWRDYLPSAPFLYVERHHSALTWTPDPFASDFAELVDELVGSLDRRQAYFADVEAVMLLIAKRIDPRSARAAFSGISFPQHATNSTIQISPFPRRVRNESV